MQAVNNRILLRMNSLPDLKVENKKANDEIETKPKEKLSEMDSVEISELLSSVAKLHINRVMSVRNPKTKHMVD